MILLNVCNLTKRKKKIQNSVKELFVYITKTERMQPGITNHCLSFLHSVIKFSRERKLILCQKSSLKQKC